MDGRTALMILGVMLLVLLGWGWPMLAAVYCEKQEREKGGEPDSFDERQKLARQRAGNHALYVLVGFLAVWACADLGGWFLRSRAPWYLAFGIVVALGGVVLYKRLLLPRLKKGEEDEL